MPDDLADRLKTMTARELLEKRDIDRHEMTISVYPDVVRDCQRAVWAVEQELLGRCIAPPRPAAPTGVPEAEKMHREDFDQ